MLSIGGKVCFNSVMDSKIIIDALGGTSEVASMCECTPQAVSQWFGVDASGEARSIPKARLMYLKAIRPDVFSKIEQGQSRASESAEAA